jgi:hypothetical protein
MELDNTVGRFALNMTDFAEAPAGIGQFIFEGGAAARAITVMPGATAVGFWRTHTPGVMERSMAIDVMRWR